MFIAPIDKTQQQLVCSITNQFLQTASELYKTDFSIIPVNFSLKGRAAGMYRVQNNQRSIRYNPYLFAKYFNDNLSTTIPHEVAHYITDILYGLRNIKPHGNEWRSVMLDFGAKPQVTGRYDLSGIPIRQQQKFEYQCDCSQHKLSTVRHNRIKNNKARYHCRSCGATLRSINDKKTSKFLRFF